MLEFKEFQSKRNFIHQEMLPNFLAQHVSVLHTSTHSAYSSDLFTQINFFESVISSMRIDGTFDF